MSQSHLPLSAAAARRLTLDTEPFLSCDDCFDLVDRYVEALLADPDPDHNRDPDHYPDHDLAPMRTHLTGCVACAEEARSLIALVAEQDGIDPTPALSRLQDDPT
jgi:hypothetical protein